MLKKEITDVGMSGSEIDYSSKIPSLKFHRPKKKTSKPLKVFLKVLAFIVFFMYCYGLILVIPIILQAGYYLIYPQAFDRCDNYSFIGSNISLNCYKGGEIYPINITLAPKYVLDSKIPEATTRTAHIDYTLTYILAIPAFILFLFVRKRLHTQKPKPKYKMIVYPQDVRKIDGKWAVELPSFDNDVLDYSAKGDFSDYIEKIRIKELNVYRINRKGKRTKNNSLEFWKAKLTFSKKPKHGSLTILFK